MNIGTSIYVHSLTGNYYTALIGNKFGYIHKDSVQLQFTPSVRYLEVIQRNAEIYSIKDGAYVRIGNLKKGKVYTRTGDAGAFNEVQIGADRAYIKKKATKPLFSAVIANPAENSPAIGSIVLSQEELVYGTPSENTADSLGKLLNGQKVNYVALDDGWYVTNFLGRIGYIKQQGTEKSGDISY